MAEALLALIFVAGWIVIYVTIRRVVYSEMDELRAEIYEHTRTQADAAAALTRPPAAPAVIAAPPPPAKKDNEVSVETLAIISAAVASFLGKSVRVRHARPLPAYGSSPWAQQGRVFIQASHNLAMAARSRG